MKTYSLQVCALLLVLILLSAPGVSYAQSVTPNDPYYSSQWALPKIGLPNAWATTTGSSAVTIAVIDTGVTAVTDLAANLIPGWNFNYNNTNTTDVANHGSLVASVAAAVTNNGNGVAGVCWNCKIMPLVASDVNGNPNAFYVADALNYAADHGVKVAIIGFPLAGIPVVQQAAQYFFNKGGVVLLPIGNGLFFDSTPMPLLPGAPAPYMLTVSGTDADNSLNSAAGNEVALAAPVSVSAATAYDGNYTTIAGGTEYSAALIGGVAALMFSANPCLSATQVTNILTQTAVDLGTSGWDPGYGWGLVNANQAVMTAAHTSCSTTKTNSSTALTSSLSPSVFGQTVIFTASVSPSSATGTVTFLDGTTTLGRGTLSGGVATLSTAALAVGTHSITASYSGDSNNNSSVSVAVAQAVNTVSKTSTTTVVASSLNPSTSGQSVIFTATVSPSSATGTVTFLDGTSTLGSSILSNGKATLTTSSLATGGHSITASYSGDSNDNSSVSAIQTQTVNAKAKNSTTTGLSSNLNPSTSGQSVTFTSTVTPSTATGTVTFYDGTASLGVATISGGVAALSTSSLAAGGHSINSAYSGDSSNSSSTSAALMQTVNPASKPLPTLDPFTASPSTITRGQSATLSWNVNGATSVSISNGVGTVTGSSVSVSPSQTTTYTLTATNSAGSISAQATVTVTPAQPSAPVATGSPVVTAWPSSAAQGQIITLTGRGFLASNVLLISSPGVGLHELSVPSTNGTTLTFSLNPASFSVGVNTLYVSNVANGESNGVAIAVVQ